MKILTIFALQLKETQELICEKGYKVLKQNERHTTCTFISGKQPNESCTDYISTFSCGLFWCRNCGGDRLFLSSRSQVEANAAIFKGVEIFRCVSFRLGILIE